MNRRDVIIIAVLVNAGLLVILFASALKSGNKQTEISLERENSNPTSVVAHHDLLPPRGDEVDQVLSQFATVNPPPQNESLSAAPTPVLQPFTAPTPSSDTMAPLPSLTNDTPNFGPPQTLSITPPVIQNTGTFAGNGDDTSFKEVKVKKGDALEKIARMHQTSVQEIMRVNHLSSTQLKIGQVLKIATPKDAKVAKTSLKSSQKEIAPTATSEEAKFYIVKNGDNPWTIAVKNHLKVDELLKLNGLDEEKARKLKPGDQLRIR